MKHSKMKFIVGVLLFRGLLDLTYYKFVAPYYGYAGLVWEEAPLLVIILSYLFVILTAGLIPLKEVEPSHFMAGFLYLVAYVPTTTLMSFGGFPLPPLLWLTLAFLVLLFLSSKKLAFQGNVAIGKRGELLFIMVSSLFIVGFVILDARYGLKLPSSVLDIYGTREAYKESLTGNSVVGYILIWLGNIITPFMIIWALMNRKIMILAISVLGQLAIFAIAGFKSQFFAVAYIFWILLGLRFFRPRIMEYMVVTLCGLLLAAAGTDYLMNGFTLTGIFSRRIFFLPSQLYYHYYDFFSHNPKTYLSQSIVMSWLVNYPYNMPIPNLIGLEYFRSSMTSANGNMWADAYASFGVFGMFLFTWILWLLLQGIDSLARGKNVYMVYTLLAMPLFSLTNAALLTTMLTHGLLLSIMLLVLLPHRR